LPDNTSQCKVVYLLKHNPIIVYGNMEINLHHSWPWK